MSTQTQQLLQRLSRGLVVYGAIGVVLALVMSGAIVVLTGRLDSVVGRVSDNLGTISATVDQTATALDRANSTSASVAATVGQAGPALQKVDGTVTGMISTLRDLQSTSAAASFLGQTPLASLADRFGSVADSLAALHGEISTLGGSLADNQANLARLGTSLSDVAVQLRGVDAILGSGEIQGSLAETVTVIRWTMLLLAAMFAAPAVAALAFGVWIRRQLGDLGPAVAPARAPA